MTTSSPARPGIVVEGRSGTVARVIPHLRAQTVPVATPYGAVTDVWLMPGGMHIVTLRGSGDEHGFLLCYVDDNVRQLAKQLGLCESMAVDIWHFQKLFNVHDDAEARDIAKHCAHAAAEGAVPFEPIRPDQRALWSTCVDAMAALVTRKRA